MGTDEISKGGVGVRVRHEGGRELVGLGNRGAVCVIVDMVHRLSEQDEVYNSVKCCLSKWKVANAEGIDVPGISVNFLMRLLIHGYRILTSYPDFLIVPQIEIQGEGHDVESTQN